MEEFLKLLDEMIPAKDGHPMFLATWDGEYPRVRPVSLVRDGLRFYLGTDRCCAKSKQIATNPNVEFVVLLKKEYSGYIRVAGKAVEVTGPQKHEVWERAGGYDVTHYYEDGLDNPQFIMFRIVPERVMLMSPGEMNEKELPISWFA